MAALRDKALGASCVSDDLPFVREVILRAYQPTDPPTYCYEGIQPKPYVKERPDIKEGKTKVQGVTGNAIVYEIRVSASYSEAELRSQLVAYIIDGDIDKLNAGDHENGRLCELRTIENFGAYWQIILEEKVTEQSFRLA